MEPRNTIRIGRELHDDIVDFLIILRNSKGEVYTRASNDSWAIGAMEGALNEIEFARRKALEGGDGR